ncbi:MAG: T9SS type A sorting domain-containing protein [Cyclobacteriaceae bacterium]
MQKVILLLILSVLFAGSSMAQDWIVYSESFETADDVSNWGVFVGSSGFTEVGHNATAGVGGTGAIEFTDGGFGFLIERAITATAGYHYSLTFDIKTSNWADTRELDVSIIGIDDNSKSVSISDLTDFTTITIGGTASATSGYISIQGDNGGDGANTVWIDNITLSVNKPFILESFYEEEFETADDASNWGAFVGSSGFTSTGQNASAGVGGSGALEFTDGGFGFLIERPITVTQGAEYSLMFDVKTSNWADTRELDVSIIGIEDRAKSVSISNLTDFTTIAIVGTASATSGYIRIQGDNGGDGANTVWIDNISLTSIDMETVIWNGSAWNNGSGPTASDNVMVDAPLTVSGDMSVNNIEVTENGGLTIESGASLAIMESAIGTATVMRNTTGSGGYSIVGSPVFGADLSDLSADYLYGWDGSAWATPAGPMMPGTGYFAGYDAAAPAVSLTGDLVSGDQSVAISTAGDGFNIVANPYTASISIVSFLAANANIDGSVYLWNDGGQNADASDRGGDYVTVNDIGTVGSENLGDGVSGSNVTAANTDIGSMQGFFVHATSDATVDFTPLMQTDIAGANSDDNFYRSVDQSTLKLALSGDFYNEVLFGFRADATIGVDRLFDAPKLVGNENFAFYSMIEDSKFAIQGLPELNSDMQLTLGYDVKEAGVYTLSIKEIEGIPTGFNVIANHNGVSYNLSKGAASLNLTSGSGEIELSLTSATLSTQTVSDFNVYNNAGKLNIVLGSSVKSADIHIFDISGKSMIALNNESFNEGRWIKPVNLQSGEIYILKVQSTNGTLTKKFVY